MDDIFEMDDFAEIDEEISKAYSYNALPFLLNRSSDKNNIMDQYIRAKLDIPDTRIYLVPYTIIESNSDPFLQILLVKNEFKEILEFMKIDKRNVTPEQLIDYCSVYILHQLKNYIYSHVHNKLKFEGLYEYRGNIYLFYDASDLHIKIETATMQSELWLALIDEIVNYKKVCDIHIDENVSRFFLHNEELCYIKNIHTSQNYELPIVAYTGKPSSKLRFTYIFGETSKDKTAILGPYYYFTNYKNAFKMGGWSETGKPEYNFEELMTDNEFGRYISGGIIRYALFLGNTKYIENNLNDPPDTSEIKKERLNDESLDNKMEKLTMRISDHDGKWTYAYDSAYLGNVELDDESIFKDNTPMYVVKKYEQQCPLTYHMIDKGTLSRQFDPEKIYYRLA